MVPAHPPLPTASYFPFQPVAGSQTSNLISESLVGVDVAVIRQNAGIFANGLEPSPHPALPPLPGGTKAPAPTTWAELILALGSERLARFSHAVAADAGTAPASATAKT